MLTVTHFIIYSSFVGAIISVPVSITPDRQSTLENTATALQILTAFNNMALAFQNFGNAVSNIFNPTQSPIENLVGSLTTTTRNPIVEGFISGVQQVGNNIQQVFRPTTTTKSPLGALGGLLGQGSTTRGPLGGLGNIFTTTTKSPLGVIGENIGNVVRPPGLTG